MWLAARMTRIVWLLRAGLAGGALLALGIAGATTDAAIAPCTPTQLSASMTPLSGSAAAGQISYALRLKDVSRSSCLVSGRPGLTLLGRHGHALPTHVVADRPGTATAALITLAHGASAVANARFSPDVHGPTEQHPGRCERPAYGVRVTLASPGHGTLMGSVRPPTPVCQRGRIVLGLLHAAG
jgi:hypothetical protein